MQGTQIWILDRDHPLEEETADQCNSLAKETSWTEEPEWLRSLGLQKMDHDLAAEQQKQTRH